MLQLIPLILQLLGWILSRSNASNEVKKAYYGMLQAIVEDESSSSHLRTSAMKQRENILKKIREKGGNNE